MTTPLRCPACLDPLPPAGRCRCGRDFNRAGILDLLGAPPGDTDAKQRAMNHPAFARLYESPIWRPLHTRLASGHPLDEEISRLLALAGSGLRRQVDLACGTGLYARAMARRNPRSTVIGIDLSEAMLRQAQRSGAPVLWVRASADRLPLGDASVDHLNCAGALHLFPDLDRVLDEVARVLAPGGVLTLMTAARAPGRADALLRRVVPIRPLDPEALQAKLRARGLEDLRAETRRATLLLRATAPGAP